MKKKRIAAAVLAAMLVFGSTVAYADPVTDVIVIQEEDVEVTRDFDFAPGCEPEGGVDANDIVSLAVETETDSDGWSYYKVTYTVAEEYRDIYDVYVRSAHAGGGNWGTPMEGGWFQFGSIFGKGGWVGLVGTLYPKGTEYCDTNVAEKNFTFAEGSEPTEAINANDCVVVTFDSDKVELEKSVKVTVALADKYKDKYELEVTDVIGTNISEQGFLNDDGVTYTVYNHGWYYPYGNEHVINVTGTLTAKKAADDNNTTPDTDTDNTPATPGNTDPVTPGASDEQTVLEVTLKNVDSEKGIEGEALDKLLFGDSGWTWNEVEKIEFTSDDLFSVSYKAEDGWVTLGEAIASDRAGDDDIWSTAWTLLTADMAKKDKSAKVIAKDGTINVTAKVYIKTGAEKPADGADQQPTGIALATAPVILAAGFVIIAAKKRK